ncbi:hypothetical protein LNW73_34595, partial [Streptomyces sp. RKAG337]|nr:hypothetical protein [Streptomyces sp. RKAG337]
ARLRGRRAFDPETAVESALSEILTYIPHLPGQVRARPAELDAMAEDFDLVRRLPDHAALFGLQRMAAHADSYLRPTAVRPLAELYSGGADAFGFGRSARRRGAVP